MLTGESRYVCCLLFDLTNLAFLNSDLQQETKPNQEEHVLICNKTTLKARDEAESNLQTPPEDVPRMRLIAPVAGAVGAISVQELQGNSKRPRISPTALYPQPKVLTKPATSTPAMIIPHLLSHRTAISHRVPQ
jgi:hypothetical protein